MHCSRSRRIKRWRDKTRKSKREEKRGQGDILCLRRQYTGTSNLSSSPIFSTCSLLSVVFHSAACSDPLALVPYHPAPTQTHIFLPSTPLLLLFRAVGTHPGGTMASDSIPMHRPRIVALRYGILSLSHKQVEQHRYTLQGSNKGTRFPLR